MFRNILRVAVPLGAVIPLLLTAAAARASPAASTPGWRVTAPLPASSSQPGLAATGADDVWTAGAYCTHPDCETNTLQVRRWNGKAWQLIPVPKQYVNSATELWWTRWPRGPRPAPGS